MSRIGQARGYWPRLIFRPVNKARARFYLGVAIGEVGALGFNVSFTLADQWDQILKLSEHLGRKEAFEHVEPLHYLSVALAGAAAVLLVGVLARLLDAQFIYNLAIGLLLAAFILVVVAWLAIPSESSMALKAIFMVLIVFVFIVMAVWAVSYGSMAEYYFREGSYGDIAAIVVENSLVLALIGYSVFVFWGV